MLVLELLLAIFDWSVFDIHHMVYTEFDTTQSFRLRQLLILSVSVRVSLVLWEL